MISERDTVLLRVRRPRFRTQRDPAGRRYMRRFGVMLLGAVAWATSVCAQSAVPNNRSLVPEAVDAFYDGYQLRDGETVQHLRLHYATLGSPHRNLNGEIENAVMILHWTGNSGAALLTPEYLKFLFAAGAPLDAQRYYLIFPDDFGHGKSTKPSDGQRANFPHYGYNDLVDLQHKLVTETLGVRNLHAILGLSMGGMNAWQWAEAYPNDVSAIMPVVSLPVAVSGRNLLWRRLAIATIRSDPEWRRGDYVKPSLEFVQAYLLLRMMIDGVPHLQAVIPNTKAADEYMAEAVEEISRADPNDLLYSLESSADYDPEPSLSKIRAKVYALNFSDDEFNSDVLQILQTRIKLIKDARFSIQQGSSKSYGHLTMAHPALWADHVRDFMNWIEAPSAEPAQ
jgi:homoserine O-acetyltransferase/O-succinyltransferase